AQVLRFLGRGGDRDDHAPTVGHLVEERLRHACRRRGDEDDAVRRAGGPAEAAVGDRDLDVFEAKAPQRLRRMLREGRLAFDCDDATAQTAQHRGRVTRPRPHLERDVVGLRRGRLRHQGHDEWLRDGLPALDRQGAVFVCMAAHARGKELLARDRGPRLQHALVCHAVRAELLGDHLLRRCAHQSSLSPESTIWLVSFALSVSSYVPQKWPRPVRQRSRLVRRTGPAHSRVEFAHPSEQEFARFLDYYRIRGQYEPVSFPIAWEGSRVAEMFTPDFYLPEHDLYIELTTMKQSLVTPKNRKLRLLREVYPDINVRLLYR